MRVQSTTSKQPSTIEHAARHHLEAAKHHEAGARMKRQEITLTLLTDTISRRPTTQRKRQNNTRRNMATKSSRGSGSIVTA